MTFYKVVPCKQVLKGCYFIVPSLLMGMQFNFAVCNTPLYNFFFNFQQSKFKEYMGKLKKKV